MANKLVLILLTVLSAAAQEPPVVDPGGPAKAPSDALVLFDGSGVGEWMHPDGRPAEWTVEDGVLICKSGSGDIVSRRKFNSAQIHIEFSTPSMPQVQGQARGNSGVYLQGRYEVQILDSYRNPTYPHGQAAAVYGQYPPLVNASRPPEQWQSYDFILQAARCDPEGRLRGAPTLTLLHNGVLVQNRSIIRKPTPGSDGSNPCLAGPILLQDHFHPDVKDTRLRFRNIWVRPLD
jgi:hypothetical protein